MRSRGLCPSRAFLWVLLGVALFLLSREPGFLGRSRDPFVPGHWVRLTDPDFGSSFHSFQEGQALGSLAARQMPRLAGLLDEACRQIPLEAGTEIRLGRAEGGEKRSCAVSPLPERCRYLLGMPLDVNRAGQDELQLLPGVGPRLAERIIEVRGSIGCFSLPNDLLRVPGIGRGLLQRMEGRISFGPGPWPAVD
jgi:competence protein ComEA